MHATRGYRLLQRHTGEVMPGDYHRDLRLESWVRPGQPSARRFPDRSVAIVGVMWLTPSHLPLRLTVAPREKLCMPAFIMMAVPGIASGRRIR
ncbi:MAG TPA: hypothetical protein VJ891_07805, partial [Casimicrobiaceae bacterium]|nr:hypothetical protein [Casimicrobiaceae bacterium]